MIFNKNKNGKKTTTAQDKGGIKRDFGLTQTDIP
jgi:hypothetical protein